MCVCDSPQLKCGEPVAGLNDFGGCVWACERVSGWVCECVVLVCVCVCVSDQAPLIV